MLARTIVTEAMSYATSLEFDGTSGFPRLVRNGLAARPHFGVFLTDGEEGRASSSII